MPRRRSRPSAPRSSQSGAGRPPNPATGPGKWKEYVQMLGRMLQLASGHDTPEYSEHRRELVQRIAAATADKLGDPRGAFRWWRRAHEEAPDEQTLADVRRAGEAYGLWR